MYRTAEEDWETPLPTEQSQGSASFSPVGPRIPQLWTARLPHKEAQVLAAKTHRWLSALENSASSSSLLVQGLRTTQQIESQEWSSITSQSSQAQVGEEPNANQAALLEDSSSQEVHDLGCCLPCYFDHRHRKSPGHYPACSKESCWTRRCHRPHSDEYVSHARTLETRYHKKARKASQKYSNQGSTASGQLDSNPSSSSQATASSNGFFVTQSHVTVPNVVYLHEGLRVQFLGSF